MYKRHGNTVSNDYARFNPGNQRHQKLLKKAKQYLKSVEGPQVWEKQLAWVLCKPDDLPLEQVKNHSDIRQKDIVEDYRTQYPAKSIRNILRGGLRQHLEEEEDLIEIFTDERGGNPAVIYRLTGEAE